MEASRSYNLYNRLLQLVTCRANDNQDDERVMSDGDNDGDPCF